MDKTIKKKLEKITKKVVKEYRPEKIILFGSYAWGKPHKWSDIDLFIIKKTKKGRIYRERELRTKLFPPGLPLELLVYTQEEVKRRMDMGDFFVKDIINKGKILYEK